MVQMQPVLPHGKMLNVLVAQFCALKEEADKVEQLGMLQVLQKYCSQQEYHACKAKSRDGQSLLSIALEQMDQELVVYLIAAKADPNERCVTSAGFSISNAGVKVSFALSILPEF